MIETKPITKTRVYRKYPLANVALYNGTTILHFSLAGLGLIIGYGFLWWGWAGYLFGSVYLIFAFT